MKNVSKLSNCIQSTWNNLYERGWKRKGYRPKYLGKWVESDLVKYLVKQINNKQTKK